MWEGPHDRPLKVKIFFKQMFGTWYSKAEHWKKWESVLQGLRVAQAAVTEKVEKTLKNKLFFRTK